MSSATPAGVPRRPIEDAPVRVLSARPNLLTRLKNLANRRELLTSLITSDIRIKYKSSVLGIFWSMLAPAMTLGIYFLVFSVFLKNGIPNFFIYLFSGLVVWNLFQTAINTATGVIVDRASLVKKVSFPREILALANVGASVVYFFIQLGVLALVLLLVGHAPAWNYMWILPVSFASLYFFTASVAMVTSALNVYLRDIKHLMEVMLMLWFYLTPIVYSYENTISLKLHRHGIALLYFLNPVTLIVLTFQRVFYVATSVTSTVAPHPILSILPTWSVSHFLFLNLALLAIMVVLFLVSLTIFGRLEGNFESEL
ncbi:MAG: ABC transporter permease [Acidimicrobiales bacterium]